MKPGYRVTLLLLFVLWLIACAGEWFVIAVGFTKGLIFLVGSAIIAWLGWRDDLRSLSRSYKLQP
jgi:hypothetical protein